MSIWTGTLSTLPVGHAPTAGELAVYHDALAAISDPWTDYSGSLVWQGAVTNPVIGNGVILAKYLQVGKLVIYSGSITMGSTTTFGSSTWFVSLPVTPISLAASNTSYPGSALLFDNSVTAGRQSGTFSIIDLSPTPRGDFYIGSGGQVTSAAPFTWAVSDVLGWTLVYEAA